ncbi:MULTISPECIES: heavy metal translocating P-type ATPase [Bacteroidota]|jgi:Cd2+/Zn2+-exporting ATPase|uniref:P-type Zn(2+) transporter n=2 Tax=Flavobacteriaceae TaxID=49546 RepID=A0A1I7IXK0_9FLAO|nr:MULTISPECIES: heavy metal translocating P-type ATPase [Flavobacteriaceae]MDH7912032.1 heavy metal translocating P-type ATPase [Winogradskyella sp. SYSU M77433]PZD79401.1 heavy metal translocating P-type ATPase [Mesonia sp. K7]UBZ09112.1 heavy metal translocating P-type ATPase [Leeuwenhoekiella palythoae]UBZ09328.1 heavy metal translocating P-type ATPase [Leeuwenhoekiella palythoae]SFU77629.1 Cd2+/Zn2+-exporting ATPase [Pustulibacterium marinum]
MKKLQLKIPVLLPQVPNEKDTCVQRLIAELEAKEGLEKVHIVDDQEDTVPQLCFHYDPDIISIDRIQSLAENAGAEITEKYGHLLLEVEGIRHTRHARSIEKSLLAINGVLEVSVSGSGMVRLEFDKKQTNFDEISKQIEKEYLQIQRSSSNENDYTKASKKQERSKKEDTKEQTSTEGHEHKEGETHEEGEGHAHGGIFGKNTELIFSIICGALLGIGFGLSYVASIPDWVSLTLYIGAYFFGGYFTAKEAIQTVAKGGFEIDFLMLVAAIGAAVLGEWAEGALLLFLFSLGHALEHYAMNKARKSIAALADLAPKTALLKKDGKTEEVGIEKLGIGDIIVVKPNSKISADGVVVNGKSSVNQAPITGESVPVDKVPVEDVDKDYSAQDDIKDENRVFAGTINGNNTLEIKVIKAAKDSTLSRLVKLVNEAQTQKSPTQLLTDKFEKYFVPSVLILVGILLFAFLVIDEPFSASFYRAMAVLVAASPCALAISTPSAVLSGVARAARGGVLIKGGRPLEDLGVITALAFDKTGTLTEGKPKLTQVVPLGNISENELLKIAVAVESLSDHPLAKAVVRDGKERLEGEEIPNASNLEAVLGKGIKASFGNDKIYIGNLDLYEGLDESTPSEKIATKVRGLEGGGNTTMLIRKNEEYIGIIALMDTPREAAKGTLKKLKEIGIKRMIMLTGDNQKVADAVAEEIGLTDAWGSLLPEEKVDAIKELKEKESKVAMVGDGVNDAPAMANSTVGIAMGAAGSDVALETADIALMADKLETLPFAIGLSRKAKAIIRQNLWVSLGIVALLIPSTIFGLANIGVAVVIHEGSTLLVVFNALRLLAYKKD